MITFNVKNNYDVKIFTDNIEEEALSQIYKVAESEFAPKHIRIMPDVHMGKGICIGFSGLFDGFINPEHIGCDIGCNVTAEFYNKPLPKDKYAIFENLIKESVPLGFNINKESKAKWQEIANRFNNAIYKAQLRINDLINPISFNTENDISKWLQKINMDEGTFYKSIGSVGGGNHYIEYDESDKSYCINVHCGSRNLGLKVFNYWNKIAKQSILSKADIVRITKEVKDRNVDKKKLTEEIKAAKTEYQKILSPNYLTGENARGYFTDMIICQEYAQLNHEIIHNTIRNIYTKLTGAKKIDYISTMHNYIDFDCRQPIIRKGSVRANKGEKFILPFNMRDGIAICIGKGNEDWNYTSPHGAGRKMSRAKAKNILSVDDFKKKMADAGIYTTTADLSTIDESPDAYKDKNEIINNISPTCDILLFMRPKINIKAGGE